RPPATLIITRRVTVVKGILASRQTGRPIVEIWRASPCRSLRVWCSPCSPGVPASASTTRRHGSGSISARPTAWHSASTSTRESTRSARERSEEHTSELQSLRHLVCRLLLEKKKKQKYKHRREESTQIGAEN